MSPLPVDAFDFDFDETVLTSRAREIWWVAVDPPRGDTTRGLVVGCGPSSPDGRMSAVGQARVDAVFDHLVRGGMKREQLYRRIWIEPDRLGCVRQHLVESP